MKSLSAGTGAKSLFAGLALALATAAAAHADDTGHVYLTEHGDVLSYDLSLFGYNATGTASPVGGGDLWQIGSGDGPLPLVYPFAPTDAGSTAQYYEVAWREPGEPDLYNILFWAPSGGRGTTVLTILSDVPASGPIFVFEYNLGSDCGAPTPGGPLACPILANNQAFTFADQSISNSTRFLGDVTVSFNDRGDTVGSAAPEPAAWTLMTIGFGGLGAMLRRRRLGGLSAEDVGGARAGVRRG